MIEFWLQTASGTFRFDSQEVTLGRDRRCSFVLPDPSVLSVHARLVSEEGRLYLEKADLDALTFVNRAPIHRRAEVFNGDLIDIGPWTLMLQSNQLKRRMADVRYFDPDPGTPTDATIIRTVRLPSNNRPVHDDTSSDFFII